MTRQKSEDPIVPEGLRKLAPTGSFAQGGKGVPVDEDEEQPGLPFTTAESSKETLVKRERDRSPPIAPRRVPKVNGQDGTTSHVTMDSVIELLDEALDHVVRNKGAPGPDGKRVEDVRKQWPSIRGRLARRLRKNQFSPGSARRKEIPKAGGGVRGLSIPNVEDRVVQEAFRRLLGPLFEPTFHPSSHGFRPNRSCHTAMTEAASYVADGLVWVVDIDLSKFFDRVNHQRLLARISPKVDDRTVMRTLSRIIRASTVMPNGLLVHSEEGVPQGGPLSPLLSNIVLDELDRELDRRGLRFVRYADDVAIFVGSERAGERVMASMTRFIEKRLRLVVNEEKSSVRLSSRGNLLGFRLITRPDGSVDVGLSERTLKRVRDRVRELTPRNWGKSLRCCIEGLNQYLQGWFAFFGIVSPSARHALNQVDARTRRRLRAIQLKQWKRKHTMVRKLNRIRYTSKVAKTIYEGRRSWWVLSNLGVVNNRLNNAWFDEQGLVTLVQRRKARELSKVAPAQQTFGWG